MTGAAPWIGMAWFVVSFAVAVSLRPRRVTPRWSSLRPAPIEASPHRSPRHRLELPSSLVASRRRSRDASASAKELADVIDLFALAVASGLNLRLALGTVASRAPPAWVDPLGAIVARVDRGVGLADALDQLPATTGEHAHPLVSVLVSSERYGTVLLPALERLAIEARFDRRRRAEEAARRVPVKLLFPLVLCILPAFGALTVAPLLAGAVGSLRLS
jgi:tight adherence protein C